MGDVLRRWHEHADANPGANRPDAENDNRLSAVLQFVCAAEAASAGLVAVLSDPHLSPARRNPSLHRGGREEPMSPVSLVLNVLWIVFGGIWMAAGWLIAAVIMALTIIGLPWARAALTIAIYTL